MNSRALSLLFAAVLFHSNLSFADEHPKEKQADQIIAQLYHSLAQSPNMDMGERIEFISRLFINNPYELGALGEGLTARFDQFPLYRTDAFDCETYVDTVLGLALAANLQTFKLCINQIRYRNGQVSFLARNHFTDLDWNNNNQHQGLVKDITQSIHNEQNQPVALIATAYINKPGWYQHFKLGNLRVQNLNPAQQNARLEFLKQKGGQLERKNVQIPYLPFTVLFNKEGKANTYIFKQIPHGAIIEIIRPNWDLREKIGTALNVSHLGFAIWKNGTLYFREASTDLKKVVDLPLADYLHDAIKSPTIKGINVQVVVPKQPFSDGCGEVKSLDVLSEA